MVQGRMRRYLLAQRPEGKPYAELPGISGRQDRGRARPSRRRSRRELHEELGIDVKACERWRTLEHDYPHAYVRLFLQGDALERHARRTRRPGACLAAFAGGGRPAASAAIPCWSGSRPNPPGERIQRQRRARLSVGRSGL